MNKSHIQNSSSSLISTGSAMIKREKSSKVLQLNTTNPAKSSKISPRPKKELAIDFRCEFDLPKFFDLT
jgi:hypothetical protein